MRRQIRFMCRCIACKSKFEATEAQVKQAEREGCMISPCCSFPATVVSATRKTNGGKTTKKK